MFAAPILSLSLYPVASDNHGREKEVAIATAIIVIAGAGMERIFKSHVDTGIEIIDFINDALEIECIECTN